MENNYGIGRVSTLFIYFLEGLVVFIIALFCHRIQGIYLAVYSLTWVIGMMILLFLPKKEVKGISIYLAGQILLTVGMAIFFGIIFHNFHIVVWLFFVQWASNLFFVRKSVCKALIVIHLSVVILCSAVFHLFSLSECIAAVVALLLVNWFAHSLISIVNAQTEENREQRQSLDDMLNLVEVKYEEARQADHAKSSFLANMSHEIRTPINTVLGMDEMILRESPNENIKDYASKIRNAGQTLLALINDILDFSKIESGKLKIIPVTYDLSVLLQEVHDLIEQKASDKKLKFTIYVEENLPLQFMGDDIRIKQVLVNLLTNGVKYTNEGSVRLSIRGVVSGEECQLTFSVKDTGIGIKEEDMQRLFSEYDRIEEARNRKIEGTGLGISIVTQLLTLMDSELKVESVYGEGSEFSFTLVQGVVDRTPIGNWRERIRRQIRVEKVQEYILPTVRLLVVDDNSINRMVFTKLLQKHQCQIDEADSGRKCLELVQQNQYDIIFMDHMMPEMDGVETFLRMKELTDNKNQDTPVIALTANAVAGAKETYMEYGFADYLSKPIIPEKLDQMIEAHVSSEKREKLAEELRLPKEQTFVAEEREKESEEELPTVEGMDYDYAMMKLQSKELLISVIRDFSIIAKKERDELQKMYERLLKAGDEGGQESDFVSYRIKVHSMKSNAGTLGALQVFGFAKKLEYAARDQQLDIIEKLHDMFCEMWMNLKQNIDEAYGLKQNFGPKGKQIDRDLFEQYMNMLSQAMENLDTDTADAIIEELKNFDYNEEGIAILEQLIVAVQDLDIETSQRLIGEWRSA